MAFLRTKRINNNLYCYLVQNKHTKKGPRQKVKRYLGRAIRLEPKKELDFSDYFKIDNLDGYFKKNKKGILSDLVELELIKHGFKERKNFLINRNIFFDKNSFKMSKDNKDIFLSLNEGFLSDFTIKRILKFKKTDNFQKDAHALAKYFVEAGIRIPQEVFVRFYEKC